MLLKSFITIFPAMSKACDLSRQLKKKIFTSCLRNLDNFHLSIKSTLLKREVARRYLRVKL